MGKTKNKGVLRASRSAKQKKPEGHGDRFDKVIKQPAAQRYRDALEQIASDTRGATMKQIAERHIHIARTALMPGYGAQEEV